MSYHNIHLLTLNPATKWVNNNWILSDETSFLKKHVLARGIQVILLPGNVIVCALDTIVGLGAATLTIFTLGKSQAIFSFACNHLDTSSKLVTRIYMNALQIINPSPILSGDPNNLPYVQRYVRACIATPPPEPPILYADGNGLLTGLVIDELKKTSRDCYNSDHFLKRHVASRLSYVLLAIACVISRVVDGIIGLVAASLSIFSLGRFESLNNLSYRALQTPGIIYDLFYCTIKFINPWTGTSAA